MFFGRCHLKAHKHTTISRRASHILAADRLKANPTAAESSPPVSDQDGSNICEPSSTTTSISGGSIPAQIGALHNDPETVLPPVPASGHRRADRTAAVGIGVHPLLQIQLSRRWRGTLRSQISTIPATVRHVSNQATGNNQSFLARSKSMTTQSTRNMSLPQRLRYEHRHLNNIPPELTLSVPSEDEIDRPCKGFQCPFFAHDPVQYVECQNQCSEREIDALHWLQRHLERHRKTGLGNVPDEVFECMGVSSETTRQYDRRRYGQGEKPPPEAKFAALYKAARQILFGTSNDVPLRDCPLPARHVTRRRRSSYNTVERGRSLRSRKQTSRANSRASRSTTLDTAHTSIDPSEGLDHDKDDFRQSEIQETVDSITKRLMKFSRYVCEHPQLDNNFHDLRKQIQSLLDGFGRDITAAHHHQQHYGAGPQTRMTALQDPTQSSFSASFDPIYPAIAPELPQPTPDNQYPHGELDIDLNQPQAISETASMASTNASYVPHGKTWQESMQGSSQGSYTPDSSSYLHLPASPSVMSAATPSRNQYRQQYLAAPSSENTVNSYMLRMMSSTGSCDATSFPTSNYHFCGSALYSGQSCDCIPGPS